MPGKVGYQIALTSILSLNFGFVLFDRNAAGFLMPFIQPELGLTQLQVGMLSGALSLTWSFAALGIGAVSDRTGARKGLLILSTLAFSICSVGSGLVSSFAMLLATRLLMGVAEGGIMPISQSLIASDVDARHRGLAMGVAQGFGSSLLGSFVAPVVLVTFAEAFSWRHAFFLTGAPGLIMVLLIAWFVRPSSVPPVKRDTRTFNKADLRAVLGDRNIVLCCVQSITLVSYLVVCWSFMPLYLTQVRGYDPSTMKWLMGALGISATVASTAIPALSDRIGRRGVMILLPFVAIVLPLGALYFDGPVWMLAAIFVVGWFVTGVFPLFMATVPSESVDSRHIATALGVCMGSGELIGGVLSPIVAGKAGDVLGQQAQLWIMFALALIGGLAALGMRETAPGMKGAQSPLRLREGRSPSQPPGD